MNQLGSLINQFLNGYKEKREDLHRFLNEHGLDSLITRFDIKENKVLLYCRGSFERHLLSLKKENLLSLFKKKFGVGYISILVEEENE